MKKISHNKTLTKRLSHGISIDMPTPHTSMVLKNPKQWKMAAQLRNSALPGENRIMVQQMMAPDLQ